MRLLIALTLILLTHSPPAHARLVTVTAFTAPHGSKTALCTKPRSGWTVAVSHDMMHMLGRKIYLEGFGVRRVESLTAKRFKGRIDVLVGSAVLARKIGCSRRLVVML